jgi:hypothetical protein
MSSAACEKVSSFAFVSFVLQIFYCETPFRFSAGVRGLAAQCAAAFFSVGFVLGAV